MLLSEAAIGTGYTLESCKTNLRTQSKLETLGLVFGEEIKLIQKTGAGVIIEVKNSRLAIANDIAKTIEISDADDKDES